MNTYKPATGTSVYAYDPTTPFAVATAALYASTTVKEFYVAAKNLAEVNKYDLFAAMVIEGAAKTIRYRVPIVQMVLWATVERVIREMAAKRYGEGREELLKLANNARVASIFHS